MLLKIFRGGRVAWLVFVIAIASCARSTVENENRLYLEALDFEEKGDVESAKLRYQKILRVNPRFQQAWQNLIVILVGQGATPEVVTSYRHSLASGTNSLELWLTLGNTFYRQEKYEESVIAFRQVVDFKPSEVEAWEMLGNSYNRMGKIESAVEAYEQAVKVSPKDAEIWYNLGILYRKQENWDNMSCCFQNCTFACQQNCTFIFRGGW